MSDAWQNSARVCGPTSRRSCSCLRSQSVGAWNISPHSFASHPERSAPVGLRGPRAESKDLQYSVSLRGKGGRNPGLASSQFRMPSSGNAKKRHNIGDLSTSLRAHADFPPLRYAQDDSLVGSGHARVAGVERSLNRAWMTGHAAEFQDPFSTPRIGKSHTSDPSWRRVAGANERVAEGGAR